jgi:hypothetical protein
MTHRGEVQSDSRRVDQVVHLHVSPRGGIRLGNGCGVEIIIVVELGY